MKCNLHARNNTKNEKWKREWNPFEKYIWCVVVEWCIPQRTGKINVVECFEIYLNNKH